MKDFDVDREARAAKDRSFKIGGETLVYRAAVAPETILEWSAFASYADKEEAALKAARAQLAAAAAKNAETEKAGGEPEFSAAHMAELELRVADAAAAVEAKARTEDEWLTMLDDTVLSILEPQYQDIWKKIREPEIAHPLSLGDINSVVEWLVPEVVGRPTGSPSDSLPSEGTSETKSTDGFSSQEGEESKP